METSLISKDAGVKESVVETTKGETMNRLLLALIMLVLFSPGIYAQNYNPKFNGGPDIAEFLQAAADSAFPCLPFPPIKEAVKGIPSGDADLPMRKGLRAGSFYGALRPSVADNAIYAYPKKYIPPLEASQDPAAKELLVQWENINNARILLLDEAQVLELKDSGLYTEYLQLAQNAAALNKEIEALRAAWAAHQQGCPVPHDAACTAEHNRLVEWDKDLRQRITIHNANYEDWLKRKKALDDSVTGWRSKLKSWEQVILGFIEKVQAFLKDTGNCKPKQHEALQQQVKDACKVPNEPYACRQWNPNDPAKDCSEWRVIYQRNIDCYNARREINQTCYDGGNPTHQDEERIAAERADTCWLLIQESCLKAIAPSIPGRRYGGGF